MNYFVFVNGLVYIGATIFSVYKGHYLWSIVWLGYAVSALVMCTMEGR